MSRNYYGLLQHISCFFIGLYLLLISMGRSSFFRCCACGRKLDRDRGFRIRGRSKSNLQCLIFTFNCFVKVFTVSQMLYIYLFKEYSP